MQWEGDTEGIEHKMREAVAAAVDGSQHRPDEAAILTDVVVVMGWVMGDGSHGTTHVRCGAPWATRGLLQHAADTIDTVDGAWMAYQFAPGEDADED